MILGNPYKFCIIYSVIKEWNLNDTFGNGILLFCLDGMIYPSKEIVNATLKSEFWNLKKELMNLAVDERLYTLQKEEAFTEMYKVMFPEDWECNNDYRFDISPYSFSDKGCFVYAVSDGEGIRVLAAELEYMIEELRHRLDGICVSEAFITFEERDKIVAGLDCL